jgi:delta 1-pyrroline-5-carboxylate dehydrogenase
MHLPPFKNEPFLDFTDERNAEAMAAAVAKVEAELGREYSLVINGERLQSGDLLNSYNPSSFKQIVGRVHRATQEQADQAVRAANEAFKTWQYTSAEHRAAYLLKASQKCAAASWSSMPGLCSKRANPGRKPKLTPRKRLISWNFTRAKPCASLNRNR